MIKSTIVAIAEADPAELRESEASGSACGVHAPQSRKLIAYLAKYLVKGFADLRDRLRYGVQPENPRKGMTPGGGVSAGSHGVHACSSRLRTVDPESSRAFLRVQQIGSHPMTKFMSIRRAAFNRGVVIRAVRAIAGAVMAVVCVAIMNNGDRGGMFDFSGHVGLAICAVAGGIIVTVVSGIVNVVDGVDCPPRKLALRDVADTAAPKILVEIILIGIGVGGVCGLAFFDRIFPHGLLSNFFAGGSYGFWCACSMGVAGFLVAWPWRDR
ncbi:hypothetical protein [Actinomadura sp. B10D3]|uniref:hypothetical protein n=1 Tax=Actinomadura sp. B10D3 TaxID=3153557 RepID=UPI00325CEFF3